MVLGHASQQEARVSVRTLKHEEDGVTAFRVHLPPSLPLLLVALSFSLGVANAAGVPPEAALLSFAVCAVINALLARKKGPFLAVGGIAAGLAPILREGMERFGTDGYPLVLIAVFASGVIMMVAARFGVARLTEKISHTVVEAMLAGIGLNVVSKMLPDVLGRQFVRHGCIGVFRELPSQLLHADLRVMLTSASTLVPIIYLITHMGKNRVPSWLKVLPPQVVGVVSGTVVGLLLGLEPRRLLHISGNLGNAITFPAFGRFFADPTLWAPMAWLTAQFTIVASIEGLATVVTADKYDSAGRKTDLNHALFLTGLKNACALFGATASIDGLVKTTTNISAGGRNVWSSVYSAVIMLLLVVFATPLVNRLPLAALAVVVIMMGWKLAHPSKFVHAARQGKGELLTFMTVVTLTITLDLLIGIIVGVCVDWGAKKFLSPKEVALDAAISHAAE
jgi:MFS superfamily sulfate permease-like transporter